MSNDIKAAVEAEAAGIVAEYERKLKTARQVVEATAAQILSHGANLSMAIALPKDYDDHAIGVGSIEIIHRLNRAALAATPKAA